MLHRGDGFDFYQEDIQYKIVSKNCGSYTIVSAAALTSQPEGRTGHLTLKYRKHVGLWHNLSEIVKYDSYMIRTKC